MQDIPAGISLGQPVAEVEGAELFGAQTSAAVIISK